MRHGYTTGACATATTKKALLALITGEEQKVSRFIANWKDNVYH